MAVSRAVAGRDRIRAVAEKVGAADTGGCAAPLLAPASPLVGPQKTAQKGNF